MWCLLWRKSCGCFRKEIEKKVSHGLSRTRFYNIFKGIKQRCSDENYSAFSKYGGNGIKNHWSNFIDFKNDMYESYLEHIKKYGEFETTIDRINNNGNYCKENCRWATYKEQANNLSSNRFITYKNEKLTISQFADKYNLKELIFIQDLMLVGRLLKF